MGTVTVNKLAGLSLIVGPIVGLVSYLIRPGGGLVGGSVDPVNIPAGIKALLDNGDLAGISYLLGAIGAILLLFGIRTIVGNVLKGGNGEALGSLGALMVLFVVIGWAISGALGSAIAGGTATAAGADVTIYVASLSINLVMGIIGALGFLLFTLAASTNDFFNKNFTLVAALAAAVGLVCAVLGAYDLSLLQTMNLIAGIAWVVLTIWSVTVGLKLSKA